MYIQDTIVLTYHTKILHNIKKIKMHQSFTNNVVVLLSIKFPIPFLKRAILLPIKKRKEKKNCF